MQRPITTHNVDIAKSNVVLAKQQYDLDEAENTLKKAEGNLAGLEASLAESKAGPTVQERAVANAKVILASAVEAQLAKIKITAPVDGTVGILVSTPGEVVSPGHTILTLNVPRERWFSFTIREDRLGDIAIGAPSRCSPPKDSICPAASPSFYLSANSPCGARLGPSTIMT